MKNTLLGRGILLLTGEISKDKINFVAGAITQPFAEMVWATTGGDWETINHLTEILVTMNTAEDGGKLFKIVQMLYGLLGLSESEYAELKEEYPDRLEELKRRGFSNAAMRQWTFENDDGKYPQMDKALFYAANWEKMKVENIGYLLWGKVGTGNNDTSKTSRTAAPLDAKLDLVKRIGNTTFDIHIHFSETSREAHLHKDRFRRGLQVCFRGMITE